MFFIPSILKDSVTQIIFKDIDFVMQIFLYFILYHSNLQPCYRACSSKIDCTFEMFLRIWSAKNNTNVHFIIKYSKKPTNRTKEQKQAHVF